MAATGNHSTGSRTTGPRKTGDNSVYVTLFHRYISRSIAALVARIEAEQQELASNARIAARPETREKTQEELLPDTLPEMRPEARPEAREELREQAWHLLEYGLKLDKDFEEEGWAGVRALLFALAPRMERDGFRHEWVPYLEGGVAYAQRVNDVESQAQLSLYIGRLYRLRNELDMARNWFLVSAQLYQHAGNDSGNQAEDGPGISSGNVPGNEQRRRIGRAKALNQLAYVARMQNHYEAAQQYVDEAFSLLDEDDTERANCHWVLGAVAYAQADWENSAHHNRTAFEIWQQAGDPQRAAWSLQNLGDSLRSAGKYEEAAAHLQQAIVILGQLHDPVNQAIARMNRGIVHLYASYAVKSAQEGESGASEAESKVNSAQALALFELAEAIFRQVGDHLHLAMVYTNMTIVQRDLGHFDAAEESGKRAIHFADLLNDLKYLANAHDELGLLYILQGRMDEAITTLEAGLEVIAKVPPDGFQKMVKGSLQEHLAQARG